MRQAEAKTYRAKLDDWRLAKVVGWPKPYHFKLKKNFWQNIRALLF